VSHVECVASGCLPRASEPLCHQGVDRWVRPILLRRRHSSPTQPRPDFLPSFGPAPPPPLFPNMDEVARRRVERSNDAVRS
jgi:hypothetical protein